MKRIINGKRYDTETAEMICDIGTSGYGRNDFRYEDTQLYRTRNGNWFIAGEGGPMTRWKHQCGNMWTNGDGLIAIKTEYARELLEEHCATDALERFFPVEEA